MRVNPIGFGAYSYPKKNCGKKTLGFEGKPKVIPSNSYYSNPAIYTYDLLKLWP